MIIEFEGRTWEVDTAKVTVDEWRELKRKYKMTPAGFDAGISEADPDASTFLYWLMLRRGGQMTVPLGDQLKPDIIALNAAVAAAQSAEAHEFEPDPEPEPLPTSPPDSAASPEPVSLTTTTRPLSPPASQPAQANGGTPTLSSYAPSTSSPLPTSATSMSRGSVSSP